MHLNQYTEQLADFALQICSGDQGTVSMPFVGC